MAVRVAVKVAARAAGAANDFTRNTSCQGLPHKGLWQRKETNMRVTFVDRRHRGRKGKRK